jgi:hypothetical protein
VVPAEHIFEDYDGAPLLLVGVKVEEPALTPVEREMAVPGEM